MTDESVHPFEVFYDHETEKHYIFAPAGCVLVNGAEVEIADAYNGNVELGLDIEDMPDCLYAHVTEDSGSTGGYKVEFDGDSTKSGAKWDFRVCRFGAAENDGNQYDIATSIVSLGGSQEISASGVAVMSVDYVDDYNDPDYSSHAYSIRIRRGNLASDPTTGELSIVEDVSLKQFIETTPHSAY